MRFVCSKYPQITVCVGDERFISFVAGTFETEDESVAKVLRTIEDITEIQEETKEEKAPAKQKKAKK